jgi:hypothetical protein
LFAEHKTRESLIFSRETGVLFSREELNRTPRKKVDSGGMDQEGGAQDTGETRI